MIKDKLKLYIILFGVGFFGYGLLEVIWRGYTHITMSFAGGIILCLLFEASKRTGALKMPYKFLIGGLLITAAELVFGLIFNITFKLDIWDYGNIPLNFSGQICLLYSVLWCLVSVPAIALSGFLYKRLVNHLKR